MTFTSLEHQLHFKGFPGGTSGKESACQCRRCKRCGFDLWVGEITLEKKMATHSSIFAPKLLLTEKPDGLQFMGLQSPDMIEHA